LAAEALDRAFAAFKQAMAELGIPEHPGGQCPAEACNCMALAEVVTFCAYELMSLPPESVQDT